MRAGRWACALLAGLLGACDDGTVVTRTHSVVGDGRSHIVPMAAGGLPTEVHGAPFAGVAPEAVAARLRLPGGWPADIRFRATDAPGAGARLVLVFNPLRNPDGLIACRTPPAAGPGGEVGFAVTASFCAGERTLITGHLEAPRVRADDPDAFARSMTALFAAMLVDGG